MCFTMEKKNPCLIVFVFHVYQMHSLVVYEHHTKPFTGFELDDTLSLNSRPLVSNGKSNTHIPETRITTSNSRMDAVWWHPCTKATATRGHTIPPILPIALATPTPVVRTEVGYIYSSNKDIEIRYLVVGSWSKSFSWMHGFFRCSKSFLCSLPLKKKMINAFTIYLGSIYIDYREGRCDTCASSKQKGSGQALRLMDYQRE